MWSRARGGLYSKATEEEQWSIVSVECCESLTEQLHWDRKTWSGGGRPLGTQQPVHCRHFLHPLGILSISTQCPVQETQGDKSRNGRGGGGGSAADMATTSEGCSPTRLHRKLALVALALEALELLWYVEDT